MRIRNVKNKKEILKNSSCVVENPIDYNGRWSECFENGNPIYLEIGPGKCNFIIENALRYPDINFIGVERNDSVLAIGARSLEEFIPNLRLINYDANKIEDIFSNEIDVLYLNFSDPWSKSRHAKRRLTSVEFLRKYDLIFKSVKTIIQKTDNESLFAFSIVSLSNYGYVIEELSLDLHNCLKNDNIETEYEKKFASKGCKIFMLKATKN